MFRSGFRSPRCYTGSARRDVATFLHEIQGDGQTAFVANIAIRDRGSMDLRLKLTCINRPVQDSVSVASWSNCNHNHRVREFHNQVTFE